MKKMKEMLKNNQGFTLVELMIVLSIIAILAVVLVPKVGDMKDSVRNQGVEANVSSVRAFLEFQINDRNASYAAEDDRLIPLLQDHFSDGNEIVNPVTTGESIGAYATYYNNSAYSVVVHQYNGTASAALATTYVTGTQTTYIGKVNVWTCTDGYIVFGMGTDGNVVSYYAVR